VSEAIREGDLVLTPGEFGRVVGDASGPVVVVDHDGHCSVYPRDEVEAVVGVSERDAVIAERDRLRRELESLRNDLSMLAYSPEPADSRDMARTLAFRLDGILGAP
jgi:hypothetical protein